MTKMKGIDISTHQGYLNENAWNKIKASGIEFAILRVGFTGYGKAKSKQIDSQFENNYAMAKKVGIPVGVYWYSCAVTEAEAIEEARLTLEYLKGKQLEFPIFIDTEDNHDTSKYSSSSQYSIGRTALTKVVKAFCEYIESRGNYVGIYASSSWFKNQLNDSELSKYDHWIAQWSNAQPSAPHGMWQYSSKGSVNGINGNVDMNYAFKNYESIMKENGLNGFGKNTPTSQPKPSQPTTTTTTTENWISYTIKQGDTLSKIAERYNTTWQKLYEKNKSAIGNNPNLIYAGTVILVPSTSTQSNEKTYVVQQGDNLSSIAKKFNTTWQKIYEKNKNVIGGNPNIIHAGQVLKI